MTPWWYKTAIYIFFLNAFIALLSTPQFNLWDKATPNGTMSYWNKTNGSFSNMTADEYGAYYGSNASVSNASSFNFMGNSVSITQFDQGSILGMLATAITIVIQMLAFVINFFWLAYSSVYSMIILYFGKDMIPLALLIQAAVDLAFTYGILQLISARPGRTYD